MINFRNQPSPYFPHPSTAYLYRIVKTLSVIITFHLCTVTLKYGTKSACEKKLEVTC